MKGGVMRVGYPELHISSGLEPSRVGQTFCGTLPFCLEVCLCAG